MEKFDPYSVKCPSLPDFSVEDCRLMSAGEKLRRVNDAFSHVRQKHREYVWRHDPNATEDDITLEWLRLGDLTDEFLAGFMLSQPNRFIDKPIFARA